MYLKTTDVFERAVRSSAHHQQWLGLKGSIAGTQKSFGYPYVLTFIFFVFFGYSSTVFLLHKLLEICGVKLTIIHRYSKTNI